MLLMYVPSELDMAVLAANNAEVETASSNKVRSVDSNSVVL